MPQVTIFWGAGEIDRTGENQWDPVFIGDLAFDQSFEMANQESQEFLK